MKKILFLFLIPWLAFADAVIFSGNDVKALKQNLDLFGVTKVMSGSVDPSAGAGVVAPIGSAYLSTTDGLFIKTGAGNTAWTKNALLPVNLVSQVTGVLPTANGGTGSSNLGTGVLKASSGALSAGSVALGSEVSGTLPIANGGTNLSTAPTNGQLLIGNGTGYTLSGLTGTANQITVTPGSGSVTLSTPQDIATTSNVQFANLTATGTTTLNTGLTGPLKGASGVVSASAINLASEVTGTLPIANGGTGSATQNFVDLTTNQTVAGEKTFSNTVKADNIQTTGSSGVQIKNSAGNNVADFGPAGTTNASIVGGLNVGVNLSVTGTASASNLSGTNTGDESVASDVAGVIGTIKQTHFPNSSVVETNSANKAFRISTGNNNELYNDVFESETAGLGWTISNATSSAETSNMFEGKKSLSLALTGALSLSQSSTINAARKSGVQMVASIWIKSDDVSDLQLCSTKNGSEDKCTVAGGYVQGSGWRQLTVSFLGDSTSNGIKLKSTDTTGTVLVDMAYVGVGSPIVDFTPDMVYSAKVSSAGVVSGENTDWINGNASISDTSLFTINFNTSVFTVSPNCFVTANTGTVSAISQIDGAATTSSVSVRTTNSPSTKAAYGFEIVCQKQGADYKTSKAYVASSSDYGWKLFTPTVSNLGTITAGDVCRKKKDGGDLLVECFFTTGTASAALGSITLPDSLSIDAAKIGVNNTTTNSGKQVGVSLQNGNAGSYVGVVTATGTDATKVYFAANITGIAALVPANANATHFNSQPTSISFRVPIQGWEDSSVIVGSFQGYNETPGTSRVETFSFSYGTTNATTVCSASPCSYLDQIGNNVTSVTRNSVGSYTANLSKTYSKVKCNINARSAAYLTTSPVRCENCSSISFGTDNTGGSVTDSYGTLHCQAIP